MEATDKRSARQPLKPLNRTLPSEAAISKPRPAANKPPGSNVPSRLPRAPTAVSKPAPRTGVGSVRPSAAGKIDSTRPASTSTRQPAAAPQLSARPPARKPPAFGGTASAPSAAAGRAASSKVPAGASVSGSTYNKSRLPAARASAAARSGAPSVPGAGRQTIPARGAARSPGKAAEPRSRQLGMDKLQQEYESLQQKLAQLKKDSNRGVLCTPRSTAARAPPEHVPSSAAPSTAQPAAPAPTPLLGSGAAPAAGPSYLSGSFTSNGHGSSAPFIGGVPSCAGGAGGQTSAAAAAAANAAVQSTETLPSSSCEGLDVQQLLSFSNAHPSSTFAQLAEVALGDPELVSSMQHVLAAQLQRTKDGATAQSRIAELAGLVVALRRSLKDLVGRAAGFVEEGVKLEQQLQLQQQGGGVSSELTVKRLEAEAALARKAAAQTEATYRNERAAWVTSLDAEKFQVGRLTRDLESMLEQRDRAREEATRAEQARIQLEAEIKELRKAASQQLRDAHMTQGEVERTLREEQRTAEKRQQELKADNQRLQAKLDATLQQLQDTSDQLSSMQQVHQAVQASLAGKKTAEAALLEQLAEARAAQQELQQQVAASTQQQAALQQELDTARDQLMLLQTDVRLKTSRLEAAAQQLDADAAEHAAEREALRSQVQQLQADKEELSATLAAAQSELQVAQQAQEAAAAKQGLLEADLQRVRQQHEQAAGDKLQLQQQAQQLQAAEGQLQATVKELQESLATAETELAQSKAAAAEQASRLAHLEGEFEALQEVMGEGEHRDLVARLLSKVSSLQAAAASAEATRRALHNQMVELRGNIRVFCRVRPHPSPSVRLLPGGTSLALALDGREHMFSFDRVFGPSSTQAHIFSEVSELVQSALDGYHVCLFSYGQTGAGKTYTMQGPPAPPDQRGIIPRAVAQILQAVEQLEEQDWGYTLEASFIEVYNNNLRDLLAEGAGQRPDAGRISDSNAIKHDSSGGHTQVAGACRAPVKDATTAAELVARASAARACEATAMNAVSSRSHVVFMLYIKGVHALTGAHLQGCLCLVDLAGSERLDRSLAEDLRKKEACSINQSLSALGDVFAALYSKSGHVPYRNSKLTYLLQPCLGGHGKTLMLVNINPEPASAGESLCSLKFAAKVNGCETAAKGGARRNMTMTQENQGDGHGAGSSSQLGLGKRAAAGTSVTAPAKRSKLNPLSTLQ